METNGKKSKAPIEDPVQSALDYAGIRVELDYAREVFPVSAFSENGGTPQDRSALEIPPADRRWSDPPIVRRHPFEVYLSGQSAAGVWPTLKCAWGQIGEITSAIQAITITDLNAVFTASATALFWLEVAFDNDGIITAAALKYGTPNLEGWTNYPVMYELVSGGYYWFHPIAEIREFTPPVSGFVHIYTEGGTPYYIAQLERNHLRPVKMCNEEGANYWMLQPGPGGPLA